MNVWQTASRLGGPTFGRRSEGYVEIVDGKPLGHYLTLTEAQLATVPTSLLITDVARHQCDLFHASYCVHCESKQLELDRRIPTRSVS